MGEFKPSLVDRFFEWLAYKIAPYLVFGAHCGLCGKWVDDVIATAWRVTVCEECDMEYGQ